MNKSSEATRRSIDRIDFRDKRVGWAGNKITVYYKDGTFYEMSQPRDLFHAGFQTGLMLRECCSSCVYAAFLRQGDISIGDYWRIGLANPALDDVNGTSIILINNECGTAFFNRTKQAFMKLVQTPIDHEGYNRILLTNYAFMSHSSHPLRGRFFVES